MVRPDLEIIRERIPRGARVLDLGCGDGTLLANLRDTLDVRGYGLEIDPENLATAVEKGVNVIKQDIDEGLGNIADNRFDMVVMSQALQAVQHPERVLAEMLRVAGEAIITFPNFGHWRVRSYLLFRGRMPRSPLMPYRWYDSPNIHLCTVHDFEQLCREQGYRILERELMDRHHRGGPITRMMPNLFGELAIYRVAR